MHTAVPLPPTPPLLIDEEGRSQYYERSPTPPLDISRYHLEDDEDEEKTKNDTLEGIEGKEKTKTESKKMKREED